MKYFFTFLPEWISIKTYRSYSTNGVISLKKLLGTTKLTTDNKMTLIEPAAEKMKAEKGDLIAFYQEDGKIVIEKA